MMYLKRNTPLLLGQLLHPRTLLKQSKKYIKVTSFSWSKFVLMIQFAKATGGGKLDSLLNFLIFFLFFYKKCLYQEKRKVKRLKSGVNDYFSSGNRIFIYKLMERTLYYLQLRSYISRALTSSLQKSTSSCSLQRQMSGFTTKPNIYITTIHLNYSIKCQYYIAQLIATNRFWAATQYRVTSRTTKSGRAVRFIVCN